MKTKGIPRAFIDWLLILAPQSDKLLWFAFGFLLALMLMWARGNAVFEDVHAAVACVGAGISERTCLEIVEGE